MSFVSKLPPLISGDTLKSEKGMYRLVRLVGQGSFGELWLAQMDGMDNGKRVKLKVALKFEDEKSPTPSLRFEVQFYSLLVPPGTKPLPPFLPVIYDFFPNSGRSCMAMQLLGKSLENRLDWCNRRMLVKDVIQIALQVLEALQFLHSRRIIHRDVKPDNFLFGEQGSKTQDQLRVIDLGLAKSYFDEKGRHIQFNADSVPMGTPRYMSIHAHMGCQQSRRDDLEAVAYMLLYLQRGGLPWDGVPEKDLRKKNTEIQKRKQMTPVPQLIGNDVPPVFAVFLEYCKSLKFKEDPDYDKMRGLFTGFAKQAKLTLDTKFGWSHADDDSEISIKPQLNSNVKLKERSCK